jgi:hypothetical protein
MAKIIFTLLVLASASLAQSSSDGSFSVRHAKHANFSLSGTQMHEAEILYQNTCETVRHDFHSADELRPHFTVVIGTDRNEVHAVHLLHIGQEIWLKKWDPVAFAQAVVVLAFDEMLTREVVTQLSKRAVVYSNSTVDVSRAK